MAEKEVKKQNKKEVKVKENIFKSNSSNLKAFGVWDTKSIQINDLGLKRYINLNPIYVPTSLGREVKKQFWKSKKPILERLMIRLFVTGHSGKKHKRSSGIFTGKKNITYTTIFNTLKYVEEKTNKNPVEVLVRAIEAGAPREGITTIEYGGVRYPKSVDLSPQRRIDLVLRWLTQGAYQKMTGTKGRKRIYQTLGDQIIATAEFDQNSLAFSKKFDLERQAQSAR
jgi:small subunit ribosomal protein S7